MKIKNLINQLPTDSTPYKVSNDNVFSFIEIDDDVKERIESEILQYKICNNYYERYYVWGHYQCDDEVYKIKMSMENVIMHQGKLFGFYYHGYIFPLKAIDVKVHYELDASDLPGTEGSRSGYYSLISQKDEL